MCAIQGGRTMTLLRFRARHPSSIARVISSISSAPGWVHECASQTKTSGRKSGWRGILGRMERRRFEPDLAFTTRMQFGTTFSSTGHHDCRSEEHTSELQSQSNLVCRLLLEKKKNN